MSRYHSTTKQVSDLDECEKSAMVALYLAHYDGSTPQRFAADLAAKTSVILVSTTSALIGFTTLAVSEYVYHGQALRILYSGDTVVARAHWGQQELAFGAIREMGRLARKKPELPVYWFLIVKGHRTYRYLPAFSHSFYPHWEQDRTDLKPLLDSLATARFGADYNPASGLVEFAASHGHLRAEIAEPSPKELEKPAVAYFMQRNPEFRSGHELCCLCELHAANLRPLARRLFAGPPT